ncbi:MAG: lytic murein transglycosylase B, partial [Glaciimonas sp.]|nr:lytic murein transglycosylase B [Glaciimonas sp.]
MSIMSSACAVDNASKANSTASTAISTAQPKPTIAAPSMPKVTPVTSSAANRLILASNDNDGDGEFANFGQWKAVSAFMDEMVAKNGFTRAELEAVFNQTRYIESAIKLMRPAPPGRTKNWQAYRARFIDPVRIKAGVQFWNTHADALKRAEAAYGVPAEIIVGIIGVETVYGRNTGSFRVMDVLTTLAFDYPDTPTRDARMKFFRGEVENALLYARESRLDPFTLKGSYAGAIGLPQFMPSSIRQYAVDFDGNGQIDLRNSPVDAIGSVAHYLQVHGWKAGMPIVFPATVASDTSTEDRWSAYIGQGLEAKFTLDELVAAGVVPTAALSRSASSGLRFGLVDLQNGNAPTEHWLGTDNFFAITKYNRSFFYAMSVVDLGRA